VITEGFKPLIRIPTEPKVLGNRTPKTVSFHGDVNDEIKEIWDNSAWEKMQKNGGRPGRGYSLTKQGSFREVNKGAIMIVDPFSTGAHIADGVCKAGFICGRIFSTWDSPVAALVQKGLEVDYTATIQHNDKIEDVEAATEQTIEAIKALPFPVMAVIPGAETGVELADRISSRLGLRSNGEENSIARRNKYFMGETVRKAGVRAVKQKLCTTMHELKIFLATITARPFKCVMKPVQSAGSDDVFMCDNEDEAKIAFQRILGKKNGLGFYNEAVLAQEFLEGTEFVVDSVSKDGVHKVCAIWQYDKRAVNGANFVYFGLRLMDPNTPKCQEMISYSKQVLDALTISQGPSHMEVMYTPTGPCLVEVGSRCHGGEGTWLPTALESVGYTQVSVTLDVYTNGSKFAQLSETKYPFLKAGVEADLVTHESGVLRSFVGEVLVRALPSFRSITWNVQPNDFLHKTIDCFTRPGCVELVNESQEQLEEDFNKVHSLSKMGMFDFTFICPEPPVVGAVVVVDPFSSGANLAAMVVKWGFRLILVFSEQDSPVAKLVAKGTSVHPTLIVQHDSTNPNQDEAIAATQASISSQCSSSPILAIMPGAEPGVDLADRLAARYGTRNNGEEMTIARRNKYYMQEAVRAAGIRAVKQKLCRTPDEVSEFWSSLQVPSDPTFKPRCVVKPNESAGSDSIYLCDTISEAQHGLVSIHGQTNGLGQVNDGALVQEFLQGTEYVIDGVSRDGVYKVITIWEYDKRSVNGANFVYYGMRIRSSLGPKEQQLIAYAKKIVTALGIMHGPSHMEVMLCADGPCLVEVGSRCHGGEASWLPVVTECLGYSQLEATLAAYIRPDRFDALPYEPAELLKQGCEAFLVSSQRGTLKSMPGLDEIRGMPSFRRMEMFSQPGDPLYPTIDCFTRPGSVQMVNTAIHELEADYSRIRELELNGLFELVE